MRYSAPAIALHWLTAAAIAFQLGLGYRMGAPRGPQTFAVFQLHKSIGITILLLTLGRIVWRLVSPPPPFPATMRRGERALAHMVHAGFYVLLLALPLSGWLIVSSSRIAVPTFLYGIVPWPHVPGIAGLAPSARQGINDAAAASHLALVWIALAAIALHIAGALKHQLIERGGDLARMVPLPRRALSAAAVLVPLLAVGLAVLGWRVHLAPIALVAPAAPTITLPHRPAAPPPAARAVPPPTPAVSATPARAPTAAAPSPIWTVRTGASSLRFHTAWSQGPVDGGFASWRAAIRFDPTALGTASATITIDMASVTAGDPEQQSALPGNDWFAAATHPTAVWRATRFRHVGGDRYLANGTLTLRGISRPLSLPFTLRIAGNVATMAGTATVDRTVFGVGQGEWAATADLPASVTIRIAIKADRAPPQPKGTAS